MARILARDRDVRLTVDIRLQVRAEEILERHLRQAGVANGALVVMEAGTGDVLAMISTPAVNPPAGRAGAATPDELLDRARYGQYPPGSTFKLVTAMAALHLDPALTRRTYQCRPLGDGRCGNTIAGWNRAIKDDIGDRAHGTDRPGARDRGFLQCVLRAVGGARRGVEGAGGDGGALGLSTGEPAALRQALPFAAYGQGPVLVTPFKMARVAATIAAGGRMPQGAVDRGRRQCAAGGSGGSAGRGAGGVFGGRDAARGDGGDGAARDGGRGSGDGGKTGTAQLDAGEPHAWFTGFAPYGGAAERRLAFAVIVEHGGYGGRVAAAGRARIDGRRRRSWVAMKLTDFLEKWGRTVFESPLARTAPVESPAELAEIRFAVLDEVRRHSYRAGARQVFPFDLVRVRMRGVEESRAAVFHSGFFRQYLEHEIQGRPAPRRGVRFPEQLRVEVEVSTGLPLADEPWLTVTAEAQEHPPGAENPARLLVRRGNANAAELKIDKARVHIGREPEVYRNGGMHRRNDLAFVEENEVNRTVSREHAHIEFDRITGECRLFNDRWYARGTDCGTRIVRDGGEPGSASRHTGYAAGAGRRNPLGRRDRDLHASGVARGVQTAWPRGAERQPK